MRKLPYNSGMESISPAVFKAAIPILPTPDISASLKWWTEVCGFEEAFRYGNYAGVRRGDALLHIAGMDDKTLAKTVGDQTMVRIVVHGIEAYFAEFQSRQGQLHPNSTLKKTPWGTTEFAAIDPGGVCVTFLE